MRTKTSQCPSCGTKLNSVTRVAGKGRPVPGAVTVCIRCGSLLRYSRSLRVRLLTAQEIDKLPKSLRKVLAVAQLAIQTVRVDNLTKGGIDGPQAR